MDWLDAEKHAIRAFWDAYLNHTGCRLPDAALQRMISVWGPVNCMTTARYSRAVNTEAPGVRGIGYRDSAQDMLAMSMRDPRMAKNTLRLLLEKQFPNGSAVHLIPLNRKAQPDTATRCDSHLWLPMLLYAILAETGDAAVLEESVPPDGGETEITDKDSVVIPPLGEPDDPDPTDPTDPSEDEEESISELLKAYIDISIRLFKAIFKVCINWIKGLVS